jgi:2,3-bisphosphoglycerate-independent phosphoglycerate mutase
MTAMTQYYDNMSAQVAFPSIDINNTLSDILAQANYRQLRISETEKYAHVTFFFNGQKEKANRGEDRILIPSPKVATYDLQPEMSVFKISDRLTKYIKKRYYDFIVVNLVNGDMVGHTAQVEAIKKAISAVDKAQGDIVKSALENGYTTLLLADHGNAEDKRPATITSHTTNPVPAILISPNKSLKLRKGGGLSDVAPTILELLGLEPSVEMTGQSLLFNY